MAKQYGPVKWSDWLLRRVYASPGSPMDIENRAEDEKNRRCAEGCSAGGSSRSKTHLKEEQLQPKLDLKFYGMLYKVKDDSRVADDEWMCFLAKDNAFAETLPFYRQKCIEHGCDAEQIAAVDLTIERMKAWRAANPQRLKNPDAHGEKLGP